MGTIKHFLAVLVLVTFVSVISNGVVVPMGQSGWSMIIAVPGAGIPYNFGVNNDAVTFEVEKTFTAVDDLYFRPIIIEFMKTSADAVSKIVINDEYVINNTSREWDGFDMFLMVDAFSPQAGFNSNVIPDGDQLENVTFSYNYGLDQMPILLNFRDTDGSGVPFDPPGDDVFKPGYVIGDIEIVTAPGLPVGTRFGLKQVPVSAPEPMTVALLGTGSLFLLKRVERFSK